MVYFWIISHLPQLGLLDQDVSKPTPFDPLPTSLPNQASSAWSSDYRHKTMKRTYSKKEISFKSIFMHFWH